MIDWKNWKTGAKIGLLYGIIGLGYFVSVIWIHLQLNAPGQHPIDYGLSDPTIQAFIYGVILFLPLFCLGTLTGMIFSPFFHGNALLDITIATMPLYGALLGALVGRIFQKPDNSGSTRKKWYTHIDWRNWKTGAMIGCIYGVIGALYFIPVLLAQYAPGAPNPIFQPYDDPSSYLYTIIGFIVFFPLVIASALVTGPFYLQWDIFEIILSCSIIEIVMGTVLGAVIGHILYLRMGK